jgi:hypothetical protein
MAADDLLPRPASRADLPAVLALYWRYDEVFRGARDTDVDDVSSDWDAADFDFTTSTLLLEKDGRVIGYAVVGDDGDADSVSDPDLRGDGADDQLLAWLEAQNRPVEQRRVRSRCTRRPACTWSRSFTAGSGPPEATP